MVICIPEPPIIFTAWLCEYLTDNHLELYYFLAWFLITTTIWDVVIIKERHLLELEAATYLDLTVKPC